MKKTLICLTALALSTVTVTATMLGQGTRTVRVSGFFDPDTEAGSRFNLDLGYGYFIADYVEIGGAVGIFSDSIVDLYTIGGYGEYNFDTATPLVPFAGVSLRFINSDISFADSKDSSSAGALGLYGGTKYFVTDNLALTGTLGLEIATDDVYAKKNGTTNTDVRFDLGLRFYF